MFIPRIIIKIISLEVCREILKALDYIIFVKYERFRQI